MRRIARCGVIKVEDYNFEYEIYREDFAAHLFGQTKTKYELNAGYPTCYLRLNIRAAVNPHYFKKHTTGGADKQLLSK